MISCSVCGCLDRRSGNSFSDPGRCSTVKLNSWRSILHCQSLFLSALNRSSQVSALLSVLRMKGLSSRCDRNCSIPQITAKHSCSLMWYRRSVGVNFAEANPMISLPLPGLSRYRTAPIPRAHASVCRMIGRDLSSLESVNGLRKSSLTFSNASCWRAVHLKGTFDDVRSVMGARAVASPGT